MPLPLVIPLLLVTAFVAFAVGVCVGGFFCDGTASRLPTPRVPLSIPSGPKAPPATRPDDLRSELQATRDECRRLRDEIRSARTGVGFVP